MDWLSGAVQNNVSWCELVCRTCGVPAKTRTFVWATLQRSPRLYPDVITLSPLAKSTHVAGAIAHRSGSVVGISNVFGDAAADPMTWRSIAAVLGDVFPGFALVGYEAGERLQAAGKACFKELGPLRVWLEPPCAVA